jgi:hypothetical protein
MASLHRPDVRFDLPQTPDRPRPRHRRRADAIASAAFAGASLTAFLLLASSVAAAIVGYSLSH